MSEDVEKLVKYRKEVLDTKSKSFCGAKWYNATTWLGSGTTASCHHPPAHKIPLIEGFLSDYFFSYTQKICSKPR